MILLFHFLGKWLRLALRGWYKKAYVHYEQELPTDGPIIYACTHPNSAIDYLFAPLLTNVPTFVMVRGDVFEKKSLNALFRSIYMLPVYRIRDGFSSLNKNEQSFKDCYAQFDKNGRVLIFSEGICVQEKTLQPIRKGTARLALDFVHKHGGKKMYIVSIATNYSRFRMFRGTVMVNFSAPIDVSKYDARYAENPNKAYEALTQEVHASLESNFIQVKDYKDEHLTEKALMALRLGRLEHRKNWAIEDESIFQQEQALVKAMNEKGASALSDEWKRKAEELDLNPFREGLLKQRFGRDVYLFQMIILSPFIALAWLTIALPHQLVRWLLKNKIKDIIFHNSVSIFGTLTFYLLFLTIITVIAMAQLGWIGIALPFGFTLLTLLGIEMIDEYIFALKNWKVVGKRAEYQQLYDEVRALIKRD
ncbi:MAG: 1-acyl-sn-glycerol-3-phosphate acyltransferase [Flavobacteriales bacterium]|nr:1-acyl-sn-glycerol-3-phosphate acyltransferase [Flavobacteriales bacterium]